MRQVVRRIDPGLSYYGPIVDVLLDAPPAAREAMTAAGKDAAGPVGLKALVDTGASCCGLREGVAAQLGLEPVGKKDVLRGGSLRCSNRDEYHLVLSISDDAAHVVFREEIVLIEDQIGTKDYQMLIGRDVLDQAIFVYHGPRKTFTLSF